MNTIGIALKHLRKLNKLTQKQVAEFYKIKQSTYGRYETGVRNISFKLGLQIIFDLTECEEQFNKILFYIITGYKGYLK